MRHVVALQAFLFQNRERFHNTASAYSGSYKNTDVNSSFFSLLSNAFLAEILSNCIVIQFDYSECI
jgi:hypothetical protein